MKNEVKNGNELVFDNEPNNGFLVHTKHNTHSIVLINVEVLIFSNKEKEVNFEYQKKKLIKILTDAGYYDALKANNCIIAGGAILSILSNTEINDIDIYFRSLKEEAEFFEEIMHTGQWLLSATNKSYLFGNKHDLKINMIIMDHFKDSQAIFDEFDFTVCMCSFDTSDESFYFDERFHTDIISRKLVYSTTNRYPIGTLLRVHKYIKKEFNISVRDMMKIALKISQLDLDTLEKAEDHLMGMYGIALKEHMTEEKYSIESLIEFISTYEAVDKLFTFAEIPPVDDEILQNIYSRYIPLNTYVQLDNSWHRCVGRNYYRVRDAEEDAVEAFYESEAPDIKSILMYKWVRKGLNGALYSHFNNNFNYVIGEYVTPKDSTRNIYGFFWNGINSATYSGQGVLIELEVLVEDYSGGNRGEIKKAKVLRIVPEEEYN